MFARTRFSRILGILLFAAVPMVMSALPARPGDSAGAPPEAPAALLTRDPFFALARRADAVVVASVASRHSYWAPDHQIILTDYRMSISSTIRGQAPAGFLLTGEGGEVGEVGLVVSDAVSFVPNTNYVLALENGPAGLRVASDAQGIRRIDSAAPSTDPFLRSLDAALRANER